MTLEITHAQPLATLTTMQIPAVAAKFARVQSIAALQACLQEAKAQALPTFVLGGGSNTIFCDDYPGFVIQYAKQGWSIENENDEHVWLAFDAGMQWHDCVMHAVAMGYAGIENLVLIPGHVGAAPIQNIGAYGVELADVFDHLLAVRLEDGELARFELADCEFAYRDSIFKNTLKDKYVIVSVVLKLNKKPNLQLDYGNVRATLADMQLKKPTISSVAEAIMQIRQSKLPDPKQLPNSGSFFRNPIISATQAALLQQQFPTLPQYPTQSPDKIKLSAAWLIEQCGWKGKRLGAVSVYDKHALVLVNHNHAKAHELKQLIKAIQHDVSSTFQITLDPEVNLIEYSR